MTVQQLFWSLARPGNLLLFILVIGVLLSWTGWRRGGRIMVTFSALAYAAIAVLPVDRWVMRPLENRYARPASLPPKVDGVIVLGGAMELAITAEWNDPSVNRAGGRMLAFAALARRYPDARLAFSSGGPGPGGMTESDAARRLLEAIGIPSDRMQYETRSRNTRQNGLFLKEQLQPRPGETWILVTSAYHMPRAMAVFRQLDWDVVPWPTDYRSASQPDATLSIKMVDLEAAAHEWVGLLYYWIAGYAVNPLGSAGR